MPNSNKTGFAVIGYGGMGGWHVRQALISDVVELKGIYDIKEERQDAARKEGIHAYESMQELLDDPSVRLVTVAIPNDQHEPVCIACMNAGKNVISEKPVTLNMSSLERMIDAANRNHVLFSVHQNRRWDADFLQIKSLYEDGSIGDIFNVESRIHGSRGIPSDWRRLPECGGGMLYDWGVHLIDQVLMLYQGLKVTSVYCEFDHITNQEVDDGFKLTLRFENGARAFVEVGTYNFVPMPRFYVQGRKGSAIIHDWRESAHVVECFAWNERDVLPVATAAGLTKTMAPRDDITTRTYDLPYPKADVHDYYRNYCAAIDGRASQIVTHPQMRKCLRVIEAAFRSVEEGQVISVDIS